jgi:SPP1 gp7 family putative phage head morphogenesis protein
MKIGASHDLLLSVIDANIDDISKALKDFWNSQSQGVTLETVIRFLEKNFDDFDETFNEAFSIFVNSFIDPMWRNASRVSFFEIDPALRDLGIESDFPDLADALDEFFKTSSLRFVSDVSKNQKLALKNAIRHYTVSEPKSRIQIARIIKPMIGLTDSQSRRLIAYRGVLESQGSTPQVTENLTRVYSNKIKDQRARTIVRTETTTAFNEGQIIKINKSFKNSKVKIETIKEWLTAEDERVCKVCGSLNGQRVKINESFGPYFSPAAHPNCRCTLIFDFDHEEILRQLEESENAEDT